MILTKKEKKPCFFYIRKYQDFRLEPEISGLAARSKKNFPVRILAFLVKIDQKTIKFDQKQSIWAKGGQKTINFNKKNYSF